jgi:hypothetical protein
MKSLKQLNEKLLQKRVLLEDGDAPPKIIQELLFKISYVNPFISNLLSSSHTDWYEEPGIETAGVTVRFGKIHFFYNPEFIASLSEPELVFLLLHELYHIFKQHTIRGKMAGGDPEKAHLFNVAADAIINDEVEKDGGPGGRPIKVIDHAWFIKPRGTSGQYGSVEKEFQNDPKDDYKGQELTEELYKWMLDRKKNYAPPPPKPGSGKGNPYVPKVGDVVWNEKTQEYGKVSSIAGKKISVETMTEKEAEAALKAKQGTQTSSPVGQTTSFSQNPAQLSHLEQEMAKMQQSKAGKK